MDRSPLSRFTAKVNKVGPVPSHRPDLGPCWLWTACVNAKGYGRFGVNGSVVYAHRFSYKHHVGPIPAGLELDHLCRVHGCVRPTHLEPVTNRENTLRGDTGVATGARQRAKSHCPRGHPYNAENTYRYPNGNRCCRTCKRATNRRYRAKQRSL